MTEEASAIVERVARAIYAADPDIRVACVGGVAASGPVRWEDLDDGERGYRHELARAAIAAMREPTAEMLHAGLDAAASVRPSGLSPVWMAMIDAAIGKGSE